MNAMEKPTRNRRGTIFGMAAGGDETSELRAELLIAQSMNKRLMHKERRMQVWIKDITECFPDLVSEPFTV